MRLHFPPSHGTQVKGMREDGKHKTRDSQRWKRVQVQDRKRYTTLETPSKYLDETDIGAGYQDNAGRGGRYQDMTTRTICTRLEERGWMTWCRAWERGWTTWCRARKGGWTK